MFADAPPWRPLRHVSYGAVKCFSASTASSPPLKLMLLLLVLHSRPGNICCSQSTPSCIVPSPCTPNRPQFCSFSTNLPPTANVFARVCLSVCLYVCLLARLLKTPAWIWMKCCVSTDVGTWTNWLTFEPDPESRLPELDCFLWYRIGYGTLQPCIGCQRAALQREILRRENPTYTLLAARR